MKCEISRQCGSCQYIEMDYQKQLIKKQEDCKKLFRNEKLMIHPVVGMEEPYGYRNKVIVAFKHDYSYGLYEEGSHKIVKMRQCLLHDEQTHEVLNKISQLLKKYRVSIYDDKRHKGFLRHVLIRRAVKTNQTLVVLVATEAIMRGSKNFCNELIKTCPHVKSIVLNVNKRKTSVVLSKEEKVLYGKGFVVDELCGLTFKISAQSFYQINLHQCEKLYQKVIELLDASNDAVVMDTYCGIGTIGMTLANHVKEVVGVEMNREAYKDALNNAKMNKINNIHFYNDDATAFMKKAALQHQRVDCVIMDPPRDGSTKEFIQSLAILKPKTVVYVSCNPQTQVRDLQWLKEVGYHSKDVYLYDMFPHTAHVETVVLLSKLKTKKHIDIELHTDELDLTSSESKATYQEIKQYVLDKYGFKVSTLNIAQTKQECGIKERDNYNKPKMENSKQPNCPKEKEDAIKDAFRYFQMI